MRKSVPTTALLLVAAMIVVSISGVPSVSGFIESESLVTGPYVDAVIFKTIPQQDQMVLGLQAGEIEMHMDFIDPVYLTTLEADPDISIYQGMRNGYKQIAINCAQYPLNISGFRRAFAFAFNKTKVRTEIMNGFSIDHDSVVPQANGWCIEDQFEWHYYTAQPDIGNQILDDLNFTIDTYTGFRRAPSGSSFDVVIEYPSSSPSIDGQVAQVGVDALLALHIRAIARAADFNDYVSCLVTHSEYDMIIHSLDFYSNDVNWLAYDYCSEYTTVDYQNPTSFANDTYDSWINQLLYSASYEAVYNASSEMQKILHYNVPVIIAYENTYTQAYRNKQYKDHVEDLGNHISGPWTLRKLRRLDGAFGGTVPIGIREAPSRLNIFLTYSAFCEVPRRITMELYPSLFKYGPDLTPIPDLVESVAMETHSDNAAVPAGHTRFTMDIIRHAKWSDGTPLTADDVAFSFIYAIESASYGNPWGVTFADLVAAYATTPYQAVIEYNTESYWHFSNFAFMETIPKHIFNNSGGIGYEGWNTWDPMFTESHPLVTCGPFTFSDFEEGEFYELNRNPTFYYPYDYENTTTPTSTTTTGTNQTTTPEIYWPIAISTALISGTGIVIVFYAVVRYQNRRS